MRGRFSVSGFLGLLLVPVLALPAAAQLRDPKFTNPGKQWIADKEKNCWAANPDPRDGEYVMWSGAPCNGALIAGEGVLTWYLGEMVIGKDTGTFYNGMLWGKGRLDFADGAFYVGNFPGIGTITLSDGRSFTARSVRANEGWSIEEAAPGAVQ